MKLLYGNRPEFANKIICNIMLLLVIISNKQFLFIIIMIYYRNKKGYNKIKSLIGVYL